MADAVSGPNAEGEPPTRPDPDVLDRHEAKVEELAESRGERLRAMRDEERRRRGGDPDLFR